MTDSLLAQVVSRFIPRQWENVATESLRYLLSAGAGAAPARVLAPFLALPSQLTWRAQVSSTEDPSIPDLVGEDEQGRPGVIIEGKFWAALTENQPATYLKRALDAVASALAVLPFTHGQQASRDPPGRPTGGPRGNRILTRCLSRGLWPSVRSDARRKGDSDGRRQGRCRRTGSPGRGGWL
jgi:hypothetical protein